ncbi:hypothetical protein [Streptomyces sp. NPDC001137]|uniref:hypothetical protein n=1 Tax=Streptomyces sp. NPDC001137 TaxID=3154378 RepID=UPI003322D6F9
MLTSAYEDEVTAWREATWPGICTHGPHPYLFAAPSDDPAALPAAPAASPGSPSPHPTFREDNSKIHVGHLPRITAGLRNLAISVHRQDGRTNMLMGLLESGSGRSFVKDLGSA